MIEHFKIDTSAMSAVVLLDVERPRIISADSDMTSPSTRYFLAFMRLGSSLAQGSHKERHLECFPLLQRRLFRRVSSIMTVKVKWQ